MNTRFLVSIALSGAVHAGVFVMGSGLYDHYMAGLQDTEVTETLSVSVAPLESSSPETPENASVNTSADQPSEPVKTNVADDTPVSRSADEPTVVEPAPQQEQSPAPVEQRDDSFAEQVTEQEPDEEESSGPTPASPPPTRVASARPTASTSSLNGRKKAEAERTYLSEFLAELSRHKHYPRSARLRRQQGKVVVSMLLNRDGTITNISLEKGSDYPALNRAALDSVRSIDRFKPFPESLGRSEWRLSVPFKYAISAQ